MVRRKTRSPYYLRRSEVVTIVRRENRPLWISEIASQMGLTVSPWMRNLLYELSDDGWLVMTPATHRNGTDGFQYTIGPAADG